MKRNFDSVKRLVIKIGTSSLVLPSGKINLEKIDQLAFVISSLHNKGIEVVLVSSGAMGFGLNVLDLDKRPVEVGKQQAVSSVGQVAMMSLYSQVFAHYQTKVSQLLLTRDVVEYPESLSNAINAFDSLFELGVVPVVNENDAVSVDEMDHATKFGDNDRLSAIVAKIVGADLLIMLSDIDGLFDKNPNIYEDATLRSYVPEITEEILASAGGAGSKFGTGGMMSKIKSAQMVFENHSQMVLMNGENPRDILRVLEGAKMTYINTLGQQAKVAGRQIAKLSTAAKNDLLNQVAKALVAESAYIITENAKDMANAKENGISEIMQDRLLLTEDRIAGIAEGVRQVADLQDPIGQVVRGYTNLDGLKIVQKRVPMGVIAMIFESRPNVSIDAFSLAFKTNNAIILRGGRDAINSNKALVTVARKALETAGIPADAVQLVEDTSHEVAEELMAATEYVDLLIPRGGARLIQTVKEKAKVPVIETGVGNCHIYVDKYANLDMATQIVINAKTQRPSVCNAAESLVVHADIAEDFLPQLEKAISKVHAVEFRADERALKVMDKAVSALPEDFATEFLDYTMSVKVVDSLDEAIGWINTYTTSHSEAIVTQDISRAEQFQDDVDAAAVYVNVSTRFTDGFVFGLGAEIGISTQKMHARGPMGLEALTSTKFYINGQGQIRE